MTTSSLKYDHNIIIINSAESLKLFWYDQVARRWAEIKNLQILYYLWKKLSKFCNAQKKVSHAFSFQLCSTANSKFSFYDSLCEINCIKIQTMSLVSKSIYFSRSSLFYLLWRHHSPAAEKKFFLVIFFSVTRMK